MNILITLICLLLITLSSSCHKAITPVAKALTPPAVKSAVVHTVPPVVKHVIGPVAKAITPPAVQKVAKGAGHAVNEVNKKLEGQPVVGSKDEGKAKGEDKEKKKKEGKNDASKPSHSGP